MQSSDGLMRIRFRFRVLIESLLTTKRLFKSLVYFSAFKHLDQISVSDIICAPWLLRLVICLQT